MRSGGHREEFVVPAGGICVIPNGFSEIQFTSFPADYRGFCVELSADRAEELLGHQSPIATGALTPQLAVQDEQIALLLRCMASDIAAGCPVGGLYGQSLSIALATCVEGRFSLKRPEDKRLRQLSSAQAARVLDFIDVHLGSELNLIDLAHLSQLSPRQFIRVFSNTFGKTPHEFINSERISRAITSLLGQDFSPRSPPYSASPVKAILV